MLPTSQSKSSCSLHCSRQAWLAINVERRYRQVGLDRMSLVRQSSFREFSDTLNNGSHNAVFERGVELFHPVFASETPQHEFLCGSLLASKSRGALTVIAKHTQLLEISLNA